MEFNTSLQDYIKNVQNKNFDRHGFLQFVQKEAKKLEKYNFFAHLDDWIDISFSQPLFGIPVSVKDNICVKDMPTTAGSKILQGYVPTFDATVVSRTKESGGNILGKTNQDEFGFGTFSVNSAYGIPKNPLDVRRTCGGSSGGAAGVTAAAEFPHVALVESTGGSISCPAAFCGVVGITPTYGLVSRYGLIDYANSLDKIGAIGKTVFDVALLLSAIAGHDPRDFTSLNRKKYDYTKHAGKANLKNVRIAVPKEYFKNIDKSVEKTVWQAIEKLEEMGAKYKEVTLPTTKYALSAYYIIATSEASTNLARYSGIRYGLHEELEGNFDEYFSKVRTAGFGEEAKRRILLGTFARMAGYRDQYYLKAMKVRTLIIEDFKRIFKKYDAIAAPTMPVIAPKFKEIKSMSPLRTYQMDILTVGPNLAGMPHISVPCQTKGMPVGLHLIGDHLQEGKIIEIAAAYENSMKEKEEKK
ncbi:MAG: Asp-tRNA(Asn)/Glu-tRNA(Gln) amidotransferase subunit GatA [Candidatus Aenigmarchaeota archaeon]|nr:Asp-tRNA(Asn)/Glu-tRNA(Gln) amidotransferase subunit GatA [Candidatus Aenigmarchaeota archaeon]